MRHALTFVIIFALMGMLFFKNPGCGKGQQRTPPRPADARIVDVKVGRWTVKAEIANTPHLRVTGLSGRTELEKGYGMLFIFDPPQEASFWMENTTIPLSIAFIRDDGRIVRVADMAPNDLTPVLSGEVVKYALEVRQGWFKDRGISAGALADIPQSVLLPPPPLTDTETGPTGEGPAPDMGEDSAP